MVTGNPSFVRGKSFSAPSINLCTVIRVLLLIPSDFIGWEVDGTICITLPVLGSCSKCYIICVYNTMNSEKTVFLSNLMQLLSRTFK